MDNLLGNDMNSSEDNVPTHADNVGHAETTASASSTADSQSNVDDSKVVLVERRITLNEDGTPKAMNSTEAYKEWNRQYENLIRYKTVMGHMNVNPANHPELAEWVSEQRKRGKRAYKSRVDRLEMIGFFSGTLPTKIGKGLPAPFPETSWDHQFAAIVRFKDRCDGVFPASGHLYDWLEEQKKAVGSLSSERIVKLHRLGVKLELTREKCEEVGIEFGEEQSSVSNATHSENTSECIYWISNEAYHTFGFENGVDIRLGLKERIAQLRKANKSVNGWKTLVPSDGVEDLYSNKDILKLRHKSQYLIKAYSLALKRIHELSWLECCKIAAEELGELGLTRIAAQGIWNLNVRFRKEGVLQQKQKAKSSFQIFEYFPAAKDLFVEFASENSDKKLSGRMMNEYFQGTILPNLERESREKGSFDDGSEEQALLVQLIANPPSNKLVGEWALQLSIENKTSISQRLKEAWAAGKFANRRHKGRGKRRITQPEFEEESEGMLVNVEY
jgi:hypothetical protein